MIIFIVLSNKVVHVVLQKRHTGNQKFICFLSSFKIISIPKREVERISSYHPAWEYNTRVENNLSRAIVSSYRSINSIPKTCVYSICVTINKIDLWFRCVPVKNSKLNIQLIIKEWSPSNIINRSQCHKGFSVRN